VSGGHVLGVKVGGRGGIPGFGLQKDGGAGRSECVLVEAGLGAEFGGGSVGCAGGLGSGRSGSSEDA